MPQVYVRNGGAKEASATADDASREAQAYLAEHGLGQNLEYLRVTGAGTGMAVEIKSAYGHKVVIAYDSEAHCITVTLC
jgi:hypothetical protein